jgi:hypothetical protein
VETFYDSSIPSRYRLYPSIDDENKNSRNESAQKIPKRNTYSHAKETMGIQISGLKLKDRGIEKKVLLPANDYNQGKLHKNTHFSP